MIFGGKLIIEKVQQDFKFSMQKWLMINLTGIKNRKLLPVAGFMKIHNRNSVIYVDFIGKLEQKFSRRLVVFEILANGIG
jgi:hypothetical protein